MCAVRALDEEVSPNQVVVADWNLPDEVDLGTAVSLAIWEQ